MILADVAPESGGTDGAMGVVVAVVGVLLVAGVIWLAVAARNKRRRDG